MDALLYFLQNILDIVMILVCCGVFYMLFLYWNAHANSAIRCAPMLKAVSVPALIEALKAESSQIGKMQVYENFYCRVAELESKNTFTRADCRRLLKRYEKIKEVCIGEQVQQPTFGKISQKDIVFALSVAYKNGEYPIAITRANAHHLAERFGGVSDSYLKLLKKKNKSTIDKLIEEYKGAEGKIEKIERFLCSLTEDDKTLCFETTIQELGQIKLMKK